MAELTKEAAFTEWCPITIIDEAKAPKTAALVKAYRHAFDAGYDAGAKAWREKDAPLRELCENFIKEQTIRSQDSVYQCDWISEHALELVADICNLIGYWDDDAAAIRQGRQ